MRTGVSHGVAILAMLATTSCSTDSVCDEAADVVAECTGESVSWPTCEGEAEQAATAIVDGGCDLIAAADAGKSDATSAFCVPVLRWLLPFCKGKDFECTNTETDALACNGSASLCELNYTEVVSAATHNSFSNPRDGFLRPNQSNQLFKQLEDGIRGLMLDTHDSRFDDEPQLCHGDCALGKRPLVEALTEIREFLDCNPREVVTIIVEPHIDAQAHIRPFEASGLAELAYQHDAEAGWPTLQEMIDRNQRVVIFSEQPGEGMPAWYHHFWDHAFDNDFSSQTSLLFNCDLERGQPTNALFALNHFVTLGGGDETISIRANQRDVLLDHFNSCTDVFSRRPNFLSVDFYDIGDVLEVVDELNGVSQ
jgi:hypothetical protein